MNRVRVSRLAVALCAVALFAFSSVSIASAVTFSAPSPDVNSTVALTPSTISVGITDSVSMKGTVTATVDGVSKTAAIAYISGYTKATVNVATAATLSDGVHTVVVTLSGGSAPKTYTWSFTVAEKPVFGVVAPVSGATITNDLPDITAKVTDNSGSVATCSAAIDGVRASAAYDAANKLVRVTPLTNLANGARTVAVTATDAAGNAQTTTWSFTVNAPVNVWSGEVPARGASLLVPATLARAEVVSTANLTSSSRVVRIDGIVCSSIFSNTTSQGTGANKGLIVSNFSGATADGTHTISMSIKTSAGTTATNTWTYRIAVPPSIGEPTPAAGVLTTTTPSISIPVADNTAVAMWAVTVNGAPVPAVLSAGALQITLPAPLRDDAQSVVAVTVFDNMGLSTTKSWTYFVQTRPDMVNQISLCASCHPAEAVGTPTHSNGDDCYGCHIDGGDDPHPGTPSMYHTPSSTAGCRPCHGSALTTEHQRWKDKNGAQITCLTCHNSSNPVVANAIAAGDSDCMTCHPTAGHVSAHDSTLSASCAACHDSNLAKEHAARAVACTGCHESTDPNVSAAIAGGVKDCVVCHPNGSETAHVNLHVATVTPTCAGSACHSGSNLTAIHSAIGCEGCHKSADAKVIAAIAGHDRSCVACHDAGLPHGDLTAIHTGQALTSGTVPVWTSHPRAGSSWISSTTVNVTRTCGECHVFTDLVRAHGTTWDNCNICHAPGGARSKFAKWDGTCTQVGCHLTVHDPDKAQTIHYAPANRTCGTCHTGSVFTNLQCISGCHSAAYGKPDTSAPILSVSTSDTVVQPQYPQWATWYDGAAHFKLKAADNYIYYVNSGIAAMYYRVNGGAWTCVATDTVSINVDRVGINTVDYYAYDLAGNKTWTSTYKFGVDSGAAPVTDAHVTVAPNGWYLNASDSTLGVGVAAIYYSFDGAPFAAAAPGSTVYGDNNRLGTHSIEYYAADSFGHAEAKRTATYVVKDVTPPSAALVQTGYAAGAIVASDGALAATGIKSISYWVDAGAWTTVTVTPSSSPTATQRVDITGVADGRHTVVFRATDVAGNVSASTSTSYNLDVGTLPSITLDVSQPDSNGAVTYGAAGGDAVSGVQYIGIAITTDYGFSEVTTSAAGIINSSIPAPLYGSGNATLTVTCVDGAGHVAAPVVRTLRLTCPTTDVTAPSSWLTVDDGEPFMSSTGEVNVELTSWDDLSGVESTRYRLDDGDWQDTLAPLTINVNGYGSHTISYYSTDAAGNAEDEKTCTFEMVPVKILLQPRNSLYPTASWLDVEYDYDVVIHDRNGDVVDSWSGTTRDSDGNPAEQASYYRDMPEDTSPWRVDFTLHTKSDGDQLFSTEDVNWSGGDTVYIEPEFQDSLEGIDLTPPTTTTDAQDAYTGDATIQYTAVDLGGSGVAETHVLLDGESYDGGWPLVVSAPDSGVDTHTLEYYSVDGVGNTEDTQSVTFTVEP